MVNPETFLITNEYVRQALDELIQVTSTASINPLQFLQLVEAHILTADFSFFKSPRQFALNEILVSIIRDQYEHLRSLHNLSALERQMSSTDAITVIREDGVIANPNLIGWAWLYFHYVEVDLRISQQKFCEYINLDDRTIRRYQKNTIGHLTKQLIKMEQQTRVARHKQLLYLQLPHQGTISNLIERNHELDLMRRATARHVYVIGAPGIGKTVFVEYCLQEKIEKEELDHVIWLQSPESIEKIISYLKERLLTEKTRITLGEFFSIKRVAIVIDGTEALQNDLYSLQDFLQQCGNAYLFLTSRIFQATPNCLQINLHELSLSATEYLLQDLNLDSNYNLTNHAQLIWQSIGGNPLAIKLLAQNWPIFDLQVATILTLDEIFSSIYFLFTLGERLAWLIIAITTNVPLGLNGLAKLESSDVTIDDFTKLTRACIATTSFDYPNIKLTVSAYCYIQYQYGVDPDLRSSLQRFITRTFLNRPASDLTLSLAEAFLSTSWLQVTPERHLEITHKFLPRGIVWGHYTLWYAILNSYVDELTTDTLDLVIGCGICQRYLGQWSQAYTVFMSVIRYAGQYGDFPNQAAALLELAILLRYQGDYEKAIEMLDHINTVSDAGLINEIRNKLIIERVELALESNRLNDAKNLIEQIPRIEPRKKVLQLEIYAKEPTSIGDPSSITRLSDSLLSDFGFSPSVNARIHILLGRIYEKHLDLETATKHLSIALSLLIEQDNDPFALARTQTNLASLLIQGNNLTKARSLLRSAKHIQGQIGDRVGLATTIHNERAADRKIVS